MPHLHIILYSWFILGFISVLILKKLDNEEVVISDILLGIICSWTGIIMFFVLVLYILDRSDVLIKDKFPKFFSFLKKRIF